MLIYVYVHLYVVWTIAFLAHNTQEFLFPPTDAWSNLKVCVCQQPQSDVICVWYPPWLPPASSGTPTSSCVPQWLSLLHSHPQSNEEAFLMCTPRKCTLTWSFERVLVFAVAHKLPSRRNTHLGSLQESQSGDCCARTGKRAQLVWEQPGASEHSCRCATWCAHSFTFSSFSPIKWRSSSLRSFICLTNMLRRRPSTHMYVITHDWLQSTPVWATEILRLVSPRLQRCKKKT